jgi:hypothetical protein
MFDVNLDALKDTAKKHHDARGINPMRWGYWSGGAKTATGGCFYGVQHTVDSGYPAIFTVFHGDGPDFDFEALTSEKKRNEITMNTSREWDQFEGTERSRIWVDFLLSETSPWNALLPHLVEKDPDFCNTVGFVWGDTTLIPKKLWYNFTMATRFPWELAQNYSTFLLIRDIVKNDNLALYIASNFVLCEGAKTLEGPWTIVYPWSFLEYVSLEAAGRFIKAKPACLSETTGCSPNVANLWSSAIGDYEALTNALADRKDLTLAEIISTVTDCVTKQEACW